GDHARCRAADTLDNPLKSVQRRMVNIDPYPLSLRTGQLFKPRLSSRGRQINLDIDRAVRRQRFQTAPSYRDIQVNPYVLVHRPSDISLPAQHVGIDVDLDVRGTVRGSPADLSLRGGRVRLHLDCRRVLGAGYPLKLGFEVVNIRLNI